MKNRFVIGLLLGFMTLVLIPSCARLREKKAEKHQPFGPHKNKTPQHGHPQDHNHHHPH